MNAKILKLAGGSILAAMLLVGCGAGNDADNDNQQDDVQNDDGVMDDNNDGNDNGVLDDNMIASCGSSHDFGLGYRIAETHDDRFELASPVAKLWHFCEWAIAWYATELVAHRHQLLKHPADFGWQKRAAPKFCKQHLPQLAFRMSRSACTIAKKTLVSSPRQILHETLRCFRVALSFRQDGFGTRHVRSMIEVKTLVNRLAEYVNVHFEHFVELSQSAMMNSIVAIHIPSDSAES